MRVVSAVYDCAPSLSPALRSLHGRPGCSGSIDLPTSCPSLSPLSISADDEAYALDHGYASSTSPSTSLRPKLSPAGDQTKGGRRGGRSGVVCRERTPRFGAESEGFDLITTRNAIRQRDLKSFHIHTEKRSGRAAPEIFL